MSKVIRISSETYERLGLLRDGFETPGKVIERLLDFYLEEREKEENMDWIAYCTDCKETLESCPNGHFAEGAARYHLKTNEGHRIIVGYDIEEKDAD